MDDWGKLTAAALALAAAVSDVKTRRIPNRLILLGLGLACLLAAFPAQAAHGTEGGGWGALLRVLGGCGLPLLFPGVLYLGRALGAGDVKLFCMIGAFTGPFAVMEIILMSFLAGGAGAAVMLAGRKGAAAGLMSLPGRILAVLQGRETVESLADSGQMNRMLFSIPAAAAAVLYAFGVRVL